MELKFRALRADEIMVRPQSVKNGKVTLLLYQDARCAMDVLDETVGIFGWQKKYEEVKGNVYCSIGIKVPDTNEWVWKSDCGTESNVEKEKGEASDATKRAAVCWGIGRELYTAPRIQLDDDGYGCNGYKVSEITYNEKREINHLVLVNRFDKETYRWDLNAPTNTNYHPQTSNAPEAPQMGNADILKNFCTAKKTEAGVNLDLLKHFYSYWNGRIEKGEFKGTINPAKLWQNELNRAS